MWVYFHKKLISKTRLVDLIKVNASIAKVDVVKFDVSIFLLSYLILHKRVYFHKNCYQSSRLVNLMEVNASISKVDVIEIGNFGLWQRMVKEMLVQQSLLKALYGKQRN